MACSCCYSNRRNSHLGGGCRLDELPLATSTGKPGLTSLAKARDFITPLDVALRAGCLETGLSGSTEALWSNPVDHDVLGVIPQFYPMVSDSTNRGDAEKPDSVLPLNAERVRLVMLKAVSRDLLTANPSAGCSGWESTGVADVRCTTQAGVWSS